MGRVEGETDRERERDREVVMEETGPHIGLKLAR